MLDVTAETGVAAYLWLMESNGNIEFWNQNVVFLAKEKTGKFAFNVQSSSCRRIWKDGVECLESINNFDVDEKGG